MDIDMSLIFGASLIARSIRRIGCSIAVKLEKLAFGLSIPGLSFLVRILVRFLLSFAWFLLLGLLLRLLLLILLCLS